MQKIIAIPVLTDNYIWCLIHQDNRAALVFDPGKDQPVQEYLDSRGLRLTGICITHHHADHTGGVVELLKKYRCPVYAPSRENFNLTTHPLAHNDTIALAELRLQLQVIETPGHTAGHVVYLTQLADTPVLFSGDTLFSSGCGRVFEGTYPQMYQSLMTLKSLPAATQVYSGHEYTLENLRFAQVVEPQNRKLKLYAKKIRQLREQGVPSIPTSLADEQEYNPFFRCTRQEVITIAAQHAGSIPATEVDVFTMLRKWKNQF